MTTPYEKRRTSAGEERLTRYLRFCDFIIIWGFGTSAVSLFGFRTVTVLGLGLGVLTFGSVIKLGGVVVAYLVMSSRTPNDEIAPWIRQWTRTTCVIAALAAVWVLVAGHDAAARGLAIVVAVASFMLFRRVGRLKIGEMGQGWGLNTTQWWIFPVGFLGPELSAWVTAGWIVLAIIVRASMPSLFRPPQITVSADQLKMRVLAVVNAENRYHREHGGYSSDIIELRRLGSALIDSLVVVTADTRSYRAVARDPSGRLSCALWSAARFGERSPLQIEGTAADELVCWTVSDTTKAR